MKLRGAIFDFDGTLFDSMYIWDLAGQRYLQTLGLRASDQLQEEIRTLSLYQAACHIRSSYHLSQSVEEIMDGINDTVEQGYRFDILPKPGVCDFLKTLRSRGVKLCIATATDRYLIDAALARCGMGHLFSGIFTCTEVGAGKDSPEIYRRALAHLGTERANTLIFEDAQHAAATAAQDGFSVCGVYDASEPQQEALRSVCACSLADYLHLDSFWKFAPAI